MYRWFLMLTERSSTYFAGLAKQKHPFSLNNVGSLSKFIELLLFHDLGRD
jgi:hypothetical protein